MRDGTREKNEALYFKLFQAVKGELDDFDAYGLLAGGAPKDEFENEAIIIAARIKSGMTVSKIARVMAEVMNEQFEPIFKASEFMTHATRIKAVLSDTI